MLHKAQKDLVQLTSENKDRQVALEHMMEEMSFRLRDTCCGSAQGDRKAEQKLEPDCIQLQDDRSTLLQAKGSLQKTAGLAQCSQAGNVLLAFAKPRLVHQTARQRSVIGSSTEHVSTAPESSGALHDSIRRCAWGCKA
ncbi:hypothetical protein NQZ68_023042 [Dissostichus eleginoides]|nr:hypothetical protein NQZ68_023042 [Dissostichus eleginoides]